MSVYSFHFKTKTTGLLRQQVTVMILYHQLLYYVFYWQIKPLGSSTDKELSVKRMICCHRILN